MKTSVYLENAEVRAYIKSLGDAHKSDLSTVFIEANNKFGLPHDDLAEAMYIAKVAGTDQGNVKTLLSTPYENLLRKAYANGEIGREYLERWMSKSAIDEIEVAVG